MARNIWAISISKIFSKFPTAGRLVIWEPWPAVDLLQFLIKCQHPWLRTLRPTWIVADSYISAITRVLIYQWIWKIRQRKRSFVHEMLSVAHTWAAISNSCLPISNYVTTQLKRFIARTAHFLVLRLFDSRVWALFSRQILSFQLAHNRAFMIFFSPSKLKHSLETSHCLETFFRVLSTFKVIYIWR